MFKVKEKNFQVTIELMKKNISLNRNDILNLISTGNYHKLRFMFNYSASVREAIDKYLDHDEFLKAIAFNDVQRVQELLKIKTPNYSSKCTVSRFNFNNK